MDANATTELPGRIIDGIRYITTVEFSMEWGVDPSVLRAAAVRNTHQLGDLALKRGYHKLYPYDVVKAWRDELDARADGRGGDRRGKRDRGDRPLPDIKAVAARYDLDYSLVYRHVANGNLPARQDPDSKIWHIRPDDAKRWVHEYYAIDTAARPDIQPAGY